MAVLEKIRERTVSIMVIIGLALFAFIISPEDLMRFFNNNNNNNTEILGSVNGEEIDIDKYTEYYNNLDNLKNQDGTDRYSKKESHEKAWDIVVNEQLIASATSDLGLTVTPEELKELLTDSLNVSPLISNFIYKNQYIFKDSLGNFNRATLEDFLENYSTFPSDLKEKFSSTRDQISKERLSQKYLTLIEKGIYTTNSEVITTLNERANATVKYVSIPYPSEEVEVTEEEISEYYNSNINLYQNEEETRNIEYVAFTVVPSEEDIADFHKDEMKIIKESRRSLENAVQGEYLKSFDITDSKILELITHEEGKIIVDSLSPGICRISKFTDSITKLHCQASHILLNIDEGDTITTIDFAEDLKKQVENGADFGELANTYSQDEGTSIKGGDLGWFTEGKMVPAFNDSCFSSEPGDLKIVTTQFGVHLIKINAKQPIPLYKISSIEEEVEASDSTIADYKWKAIDFLDLAKSQGLTQEASEPKNKFLQYWWLFLDIGIIFILFYLYKKAGHESRYKRLMPYIGLFAILVTTIYGVYFNSTTEDDTTQLITDNKFHELYLSDSTGGEKNEANDISKMQFNIDGLDNPGYSREIVKWMYGIEKIKEGKTVVIERKVGEVSNRTYKCGDKFVVVSLSAINPKGNKTLKSVRDDIRGEIQTNKKFDAISSQLSGSPTLEEAASLFNTTVSNASDVNFESKTINNTITESLDVQNFVGAVNALDSEQTSLLIKGKNSAYVIKVISKGSGTEYTEVEKAKIRQEIQNANSSAFYGAALKVLKDNSDIIDNRIDFY